MADWRDKLKNIVSKAPGRPRRSAASLAEARDRVAKFIDETVLPAFDDLAEELEQYGREVTIEQGPHHAVLKVVYEGEEEFSYAVRGRIYHKMEFAFPEFRGREEGPRFYRAQIDLPAGTHDRDVEKLTQERIIEDFLESYRKWMGW